MAIVVGTTTNLVGAGGGTRTLTVPSIAAGDVVVMQGMTNSFDVTITSPNLTWTKIGVASPSNPEWAWLAVSAGALTNEVITITPAGASGYTMCGATPVSGVDNTNPLDVNAGAVNTGTSGSRTISTTAADTVIFGGFRSSVSATTTPDTAAGWTGRDSDQYHMIIYQIFSSPQTSKSVPVMTNTASNGSVAFALQAASGPGAVSGTMAVTEAADTVAASGSETVTGTINVTEAGDGGAASGLVANPVSGSSAVTEANDTMSASGVERFIGTINVTEANDTVAASGLQRIIGSSSMSEAADTIVAAGLEIIPGTFNVTENGDTMAAAGTQLSNGSMNVTEAGDTIVASGLQRILGTINVTESNDSVAASGAVNTSSSGTMIISEAADIMVASGSGGIVHEIIKTLALIGYVHNKKSLIGKIIALTLLSGYTTDRHSMTGRITSKTSITG